MYMHLTSYVGHCVVVYETSGQFVTSIGRRGQNEREFDSPRFITSCADDGFNNITNNK